MPPARCGGRSKVRRFFYYTIPERGCQECPAKFSGFISIIFAKSAILCAFSANQFRSGPCAEQDCLADAVHGQTDRNRNVPQIHSDQRTADVHSRVRPQMLHRHGVGRTLPRCGCKRAARLGLRDHPDRVQTVLLRARPLDNQRAVEMLAALRRKPDTRLVQNGFDCRPDRLRSLKTRCVANLPADDFRRRTADQKNISLFKM